MVKNAEGVRVNGRNKHVVLGWRAGEPDDYVASIACLQESDTQDMGDEESNENNGSGDSKANGASAN